MIDVQSQIAAIEEAIQRGRAGERAYLIKVCAKYEIDKTTLTRWMSKVENKPRAEWPAILRGRYKGRQFAEISPEAWDYFTEKYRQSRSLQLAYKACIDRAQQESWQVPSVRTLYRRLQRENLALPHCRPFLEFDA